MVILPSVGYCVPNDLACWYSAENKLFDEGEVVRKVTVDGQYIDTHSPMVEDRLSRAGVRLANLLDLAMQP